MDHVLAKDVPSIRSSAMHFARELPRILATTLLATVRGPSPKPTAKAIGTFFSPSVRSPHPHRSALVGALVYVGPARIKVETQEITPVQAARVSATLPDCPLWPASTGKTRRHGTKVRTPHVRTRYNNRDRKEGFH